jgi:carbonic anhydrase
MRRSLVGLVGLLCVPTVLASPEHGSAAPAPAAKPRVVITPSRPATPAPKAPETKAAETKATEHKAPASGHDDGDSDTASAASHASPASSHSATPAHAAAAEGTPDSIDAEAALNLLREGNTRWTSGQTQNPSATAERRNQTAEQGQHPFVTILTCADSRIPVERVFDRGVGELFVIRVAGNVAGGSETGTIEYGVGHLHTPLLVVMGHTKCGAVAAAAQNADVHGKVAELVGRIKPAVERAKRNFPSAEGAELASTSIRENVWQSIFTLYQQSPDLRSAVAGGSLKVVGAIYDISTGRVEFLGEHPWQAELLAATNAGSNGTAAKKAEPATAETQHDPAGGH